MAIAREAGRTYCSVAVNALQMARLELVTSPAAGVELGIHSDAPARVDASRLAGARLEADYRFVTTS
jgi:hypothetical protein